MVDQLKLGIIGFGWVARDYMGPAIQQSERVTLTAVCSAHASDMDDLPNEVQQFTSLDDMLRRASVDAVYIATPNHLHREQTVACLEAGWARVCAEMPMATTPEDAETMAAAARRSGKVCARPLFRHQRFHPAHQVIQQLIQNQLLGIITQGKDRLRLLVARRLGSRQLADRPASRRGAGPSSTWLAPGQLLETLLDDQIWN